MRVIGAAVIAAAVLGVTGCGGGETSDNESSGAPSAGAVLPGGGLSVAEAIATDADPPLAVSGWVVGSGDELRLCSSYDSDAEDPCGEPSLALEGEVEQGSGEQASLLGAVEDGTFVVSSTVR